MGFSSALIIVGIAICGGLHLCRFAPSWLYLAAGIFLAFAGAIFFAVFSWAPEWAASTTLRGQGEDGVYHDTYYIAPHIGGGLITCGVLLGCGVLILVQQKLGAMRYPALTRWLFWPLLLALLMPSSLIHTRLIAPPRRYVDYEAYVSALNRLYSVQLVMVTVVVLGLVVLFIHGLARRSRKDNDSR